MSRYDNASNYPRGFSNGAIIRGVKIDQTVMGNIFYVDSNLGANGAKRGLTPETPLLTLDAAINRCTAGNGDIIHVAPGHAESVSSASAITLDIADITIVGHGSGSSRPTFTFDTLIGASIVISANNVALVNLLFVNGIDNLTAPISITGEDFSMINCETRDNNTNFHCDNFILTTADADRLYIAGWIHRANGGKTGALTAITIVGGNDHEIIPLSIDGDFATACIENVTTACDRLDIHGPEGGFCFLRTRNAADTLVTCVATTKGYMHNINGRLQDDAANITEAFVGAAMEFFQPLRLVNADGESSIETNIPPSTDA